MSVQDAAKNIENKIAKVSNSKSGKEIETGAEDVKAGMENIKEGVEGLVDYTVRDAKEKYASLEENLGEYLKEYPVRSMFFALVAGFALSKLL